MLRLVFLLALGAILAFGCSSSASSWAAPAYPHTRTVDVVEDYHGTLVRDPYRWLEELASAEVRDWAAAQRRLVDEHLAGDPVRRHVRQRLEQLGRPLEALWVGAQSRRVGDLEFRMAPSPGGTNVLMLERPQGTSQVLVDPSKFEGAKVISWFSVSPDAR